MNNGDNDNLTIIIAVILTATNHLILRHISHRINHYEKKRGFPNFSKSSMNIKALSQALL